MTDIPPRRKVWRRKRVQMGNAIITDLETKTSELEEARRADRGLLCRECGRWRRWSELWIDWTFDNKSLTWLRTWFCNKCGNMLKEEEVG